MKLTPTRDAEFISFFKLLNTERNVVNKLFLQAVIDITRGDIFPFAARKGTVIDLERHRNCRLIHGERRQSLDMGWITNRV